jgi:hypothetical protein
MPIALVHEDTLSPPSRQSKIATTSEWRELVPILEKGIPARQVLRITFGAETKKVFKNDESKAAIAFAIKLRDKWREQYRISVIGAKEVRVSNLKDKTKEKK